MSINMNLSTIESETQTKQTSRTENHGYRECFDGCQVRRCGGMGERSGD